MSKGSQELDFETRAQKLDKLKFPETNEQRIIVPANKDGVGFQSKFYDANLLNKVIDKSQFDGTIMDVTKICRNKFREKQREENKDYTKDFQNLLYFALVLIVIAFLLIIILLYGQRLMGLLYAAVAILCLAAILTLIVVGKVWSLEPNFMDLDQETLIAIQEYLQKQNQSFYNPKGFKWTVEPNYYWLELQKL
ncbi:hypothetical protein pb186bvf_005421 [Paramecium bursaria]